MATVTTSDLCDRFGHEVQVCRAPLKVYGGPTTASGRIACLRCFEDAALLRSRLEHPGDGRILVVDGGASERVAIFGDNMARLAVENGWAGVIIYGAVRDVARLGSMNLVVMALDQVPMRGGRSGQGEWNVELSFGGAVFTPGHFICADRDGVVVLPHAPPHSLDNPQTGGT